MVNMIASVDGASGVDGLSGGLGGPADRAVFRAVRASCDWILVASKTASAEGYRCPSPDAALLHRRLGAGRSPSPRLAIVTASGAVDPGIGALRDANAGVQGQGPRTVVITGEAADPARLAKIDAEIVRLPMPVPQPRAVLDVLHQQGAAVVLCEGGPTWNAQMAEAGLIDELCLSISPIIAGGSSSRIVAPSAQTATARMRLSRLLVEDDYLFARYIRI